MAEWRPNTPYHYAAATVRGLHQQSMTILLSWSTVAVFLCRGGSLHF